MTPLHIVSIVEGQGEVRAVPVLIQRIAREVMPQCTVISLPPIRISRTKLIKQGELERSVDLAAAKMKKGGLLILLDSDDDLPCVLGPTLLARVEHQQPGILAKVVMARREFEAWFIAAVESLAGHCGLTEHLTCPDEPENIRDAKGWIRQRMTPDHSYSPSLDQKTLTARFDLQMARRAKSFDKLYRDISDMLQQWKLQSQER